MNAKRAWALMGAGILAWEVTCDDGQLLSEQCDRWIMSHPVLTRAVIAAVALHLANGIPASADPLHMTFVTFRKVRRFYSSSN